MTPVLVDCDGVLSNLAESVCWLGRLNVPGFSKTEADIHCYDYGKALDWPGWREAVERTTIHHDLVLRMGAYEGARRFLRDLERLCGTENVYVCTKPWNNLPDWLSQRSAWLIEQMSVPTHRQIQISNKSLIPGILIDDCTDNLRARRALPGPLGYCIARPWNTDFAGHRGDYEECLSALEWMTIT